MSAMGGKLTLPGDLLPSFVTMQFQFLPRLCHGHSYERQGIGNFGARLNCADRQRYRSQALP
jgi:hypothetical protein